MSGCWFLKIPTHLLRTNPELLRNFSDGEVTSYVEGDSLVTWAAARRRKKMQKFLFRHFDVEAVMNWFLKQYPGPWDRTRPPPQLVRWSETYGPSFSPQDEN